MAFDWSAVLREELTRRAEVYANETATPSYLSLGSSPTCLFEPYADGARHGNFINASYQAICGETAWSARTRKTHSQVNALPLEKRSSARELDSCNSSDALLMNCFCYPSAAEHVMSAMLPSASYTLPQFGVDGKVALVNGGGDTTEIDMQIGSTIFEAKLTERDFTRRPKPHVERYASLREVFDINTLPQTQEEYHGYQLIRNVLAAEQHGWSFYLICDARRPDLLHEWWAVHSSILDSALRRRCGFLLWQEVARVCPAPLASFLEQRYGLR